MAEEAAWLPGDASGRLQEWKSACSGVEYTGEVAYAREWREELGAPLPDGRFFRVVLLAAPPAAGRMPSPRDRRIAVCLPQRALDWEQHPGARGLRGIREGRARYEARPGAGPAPLRGALEEQVRRLATLAVGRILEQPGPEPIERFPRVVRAADLEGLPRVLDDGVMAFLHAFLDAP